MALEKQVWTIGLTNESTVEIIYHLTRVRHIKKDVLLLISFSYGKTYEPEQQATKYPASDDFCRNIVKNGYFDDILQTEQYQQVFKPTFELDYNISKNKEWRLIMSTYFYVVLLIALLVLLAYLYYLFDFYRDKYWQYRHKKLMAKRNAITNDIDDFKWKPIEDVTDVDAQKIREYLNSKKSD